jgi:hypothetical protein
MYSCWNPAESGQFQSFWWNGILAVLPAKIVNSVLVESRPESPFRRNGHRNDKTGMATGIDWNGIR